VGAVTSDDRVHGLALSRSTLDRAGHRRADPGLLGALLADPSTAVLVLSGDRAPVVDTPGGPRLVLPAPGDLPPAVLDGSVRAYLGRDLAAAADGSGPRENVLVAVPVDVGKALDLPDGARWAGLREVGALLDDAGAGLLTPAVALTQWHAVHPRCARCGTPTDVVQAGWARHCPHCGAEHHPRTDPAVIMAITDGAGRILLGRQAVWPPRRYSTLAGFVEPGESLEAAVRREVLEESGVVVGDVRYLGSQPWPFPSSLMLGFTGTATGTDVTVDGVELEDARWWTREEFDRDLASGDLLLPPPVSIARRLVEHWYGGPLADDGDPWR
jgi:NAD+ diphosphatase